MHWLSLWCNIYNRHESSAIIELPGWTVYNIFGNKNSLLLKLKAFFENWCKKKNLLWYYFIALMHFNFISFKLFCWLICPLRPPLFLRFWCQVAWSDCVREGNLQNTLPRPDSLQHLCFSLSALAELSFETCVQPSIELCEGKKNEQTGGDNGHQGWSHLQMRDFPSVPRQSLTLSLPPSLISPSPLSIYVTPSFSLITLPSSLFFAMLSRSASLSLSGPCPF